MFLLEYEQLHAKRGGGEEARSERGELIGIKCSWEMVIFLLQFPSLCTCDSKPLEISAAGEKIIIDWACLVACA